MLSNRSRKTQANDETEFEDEQQFDDNDGELNDLNSLIDASTNNQNAKQHGSSEGEQPRDVLLLRCRDAIEELHTEIEDERN